MPILEALFKKKQSIKYKFYKEGFLGNEYTLPRLNIEACEINVIEIGQYHSFVHSSNAYDLILLQNVIVHPKINILQELLRLDHQVLMTMIIPGKLEH